MGHGLFTFAEIKRDGGKLRPAQVVFRDDCHANNVPWQLWDCTQDAWDWLVEVGHIEQGGV
tara:strand:+ start:386 stop:568 length:183 start_codon:yes stop_codon:yes gene_type:complete